MPRHEHFSEECAVAVAVVIDLACLQGLEYGRHIVGSIDGAVKPRGLTQSGAAGAHGREPAAFLQVAAIDGAGAAGTALVDQKNVAAVPERREQAHITVARTRGRITRAAFLRDDCAQRGVGAIRARVIFETDRDFAVGRMVGVERPEQGAAIAAILSDAEGERECTDMDGGRSGRANRRAKTKPQESYPCAVHGREFIPPRSDPGKARDLCRRAQIVKAPVAASDGATESLAPPQFAPPYS